MIMGIAVAPVVALYLIGVLGLVSGLMPGLMA